MNYLITGGSGFIGTHLIKNLLSVSSSIINVDINASSNKSLNLIEVLGDISEDKTYELLDDLDSPDVIVHLAAQTSARVSHEDFALNNRSNSLGTLKLIEWAKKKSVKRFLFASSMAVYGEADNSVLRESNLLRPTSYYGISKLEGELALNIAQKSGINITSFRLFNVYGPGQDLMNMKQGMLSIYLKFILQGDAISVTGSLDRYRDFIYVEDVVDAMISAMNNHNTYGGVYNVGTGIKTTVNELISNLLIESGQDVEKYPVKQVAGHAGDVHGSLSCCDKLQAATGWLPKVSLSTGINRTVQWALNYEGEKK